MRFKNQMYNLLMASI